jgi:ribosomal protein S17E
MINSDNIRSIIDAGNVAGYQIIVRDVSFVLLCRMYEEKDLAYKSLFPDQDDFDNYVKQDKIKWLQGYMAKSFFSDEDNSITFDENKKAILELIEETKKRLENKEIEPKDALKIEADLRVKLNDKFKIQSETREKVVIVEKKYNMICKHGFECYLPTKTDLMEMYDLVERNKQ